MRQVLQSISGITKCDRSLLQSASGITKYERLLLQSASDVTKCDRLLLQSVSDITKCDSYYKVRHNNGGNFPYTSMILDIKASRLKMY